MKNINYKKGKNSEQNANFIMENGMLIGVTWFKKRMNFIIFIFKNLFLNYKLILL